MAALPASPARIATPADADAALTLLAAKSTALAAVLPEVTWLTVDTGNEKLRYTLVANRIFGSSRRTVDAESVHRPTELDSVSVIRGRSGGFPQLFLTVPMAQLAAFVAAANGAPAERAALRTKYEIARNGFDFMEQGSGRRQAAYAQARAQFDAVGAPMLGINRIVQGGTDNFK